MSRKRGESNTEKRSRDAKENGMLKSESGEQRKHKFKSPLLGESIFQYNSKIIQISPPSKHNARKNSGRNLSYQSHSWA